MVSNQASLVVLIIWLYATRKNLDAFVGAAPRWAAGWTIGAWFIPIASLVLTPMIIADIARNTFTDPARARPVVATVWTWGGLQIAATVISGGLVCVPVAGVSGDLPLGVAAILIVLISMAAAATQLWYIHLISAGQQERIAPPLGAPQGGWAVGQVLT